MALKTLNGKRNFIALLMLLAMTPMFRSCSLQKVDSMSFGFPFYALDINWTGIFPSVGQLFWLGFFLNMMLLAISYYLIKRICDKGELRRFLTAFLVLPCYLLFVGLLWWLEKWSIGTMFETMLQSINIIFRIPGMFFFQMSSALVNVGRDSVINFFNFGTGVSPDGAMRAVIFLFSLGFGTIAALWPQKEKKKF